MLLLLLLAIAPQPQHDVTSYLEVAEAYASDGHAAALREVRQVLARPGYWRYGVGE